MDLSDQLEWHWEQGENHCYVKILDDRQLEWGGWQSTPKGGGGATVQSIASYLRTGQPGYDWMQPPERVTRALRAVLDQQRPLR